MERRISSNLTLLVFCSLLFFSFCFMGCMTKEDPSHTAIREWVKKEYGPAATVELTGELEVSMPEIKTFRGGITLKQERKEGIFFYNQESKSVYFTEGLGIPKTEGE
jgi:hypothetical protein